MASLSETQTRILEIVNESGGFVNFHEIDTKFKERTGKRFAIIRTLSALAKKGLIIRAYLGKNLFFKSKKSIK